MACSVAHRQPARPLSSQPVPTRPAVPTPAPSSRPQRLPQQTSAASFIDFIHPAAKSELASPLSPALRFSAPSPPSFGLESDLSVLWVGLTNPCTLAAEMLFEMGKLLANCSISRPSNKYSVPPMKMRSQRHELIRLSPLLCSRDYSPRWIGSSQPGVRIHEPGPPREPVPCVASCCSPTSPPHTHLLLCLPSGGFGEHPCQMRR